MKTIKEVWQFLNRDIRDLGKSGEIIESGAEVSKAGLELAIALGMLTPLAPVAAGLSFVGLARRGLQFYRDGRNKERSLAEWGAIAFPLAYLESFDGLVQRNNWLQSKIGAGLSGKDIKTKLDELGNLPLTDGLIQEALTYFPDSILGQGLNSQLSVYLESVGVDKYTIPIVTGWVAWETKTCINSLLSHESGAIIEQLNLYTKAGCEIAKNQKYGSVTSYLQEQISPNPSNPIIQERWRVFAESFTISDLYIPLQAKLLDRNGKGKENEASINLETWAKDLLANPDKNGQVMFIQGGPGRGKTVFCRMFANWVREHLHPIWTPILIRLRDIDAFEPNIENTLRAAVKEDFVKSDDGWLTDANTRFLFILDGFDELRMEGRSAGGIEEFLKKVGYFQSSCQQNPQLGHRFLVTGRELALQGIVVPSNLERVEIALMDESLQQEWFGKWGSLFGEDKAKEFQAFLQAPNCPERVQQLAEEPLLLYLLAAMHRDGKLTPDMFAGADSTNAKILVYETTIDWVLTKQRPQELTFDLTEYETEDLRRIIIEAGLAVTQSGGEWVSIKIIEERLKGDDGAKNLLEKAQKRIGQNPLRNALTAFYLRPGSAANAKEGAVEFVHKSFGEFLCAKRLQESLEEWTESGHKRQKFYIDDQQLAEEIYDLLGYGGLTIEIVKYLMALLNGSSSFHPIELFQRLEAFYLDWCNGEFINAEPTENLPQKKMLHLRNGGSLLGLREVDIFAGLNVMILLFELHRYAQENDDLKDRILFYPCGQNNSAGFDQDRLLRIIHYSDSLQLSTFLEIVGFFLSGANLSDANLSGANLSGANLNGANLSSTKLNGANLNGADLSRTNLSSADLSGTNLSGADLISADLSCAYLNGADLIHTDLIGANLIGAYLICANLTRADLTRADLSTTYLNGADMNRANLNGANLNGANLSRAYLSRANLSRADLSDAALSGAYLSYADLSDANLSGANLCNISWDENTKRENVQGLDAAINVPDGFLP